MQVKQCVLELKQKSPSIFEFWIPKNKNAHLPTIFLSHEVAHREGWIGWNFIAALAVVAPSSKQWYPRKILKLGQWTVTRLSIMCLLTSQSKQTGGCHWIKQGEIFLILTQWMSVPSAKYCQ